MCNSPHFIFLDSVIISNNTQIYLQSLSRLKLKLIMLQSFLSRATLILISSTLAVLGVGCHDKKHSSGIINNHTTAVSHHLPAPSSVIYTPTPKALPSSQPEMIFFEMGLDKGMGAWSISQSAQSLDDWKLVIGQYQEAIALMKRVPQESPEFATAQSKISEYRKLIKTARQKANTPLVPSPKADNKSIVVAVPQPQTQPSVPIFTPPASTPQSPVKPISPLSWVAPEKQVFIAPIKRRIGGTPVVEVTFNNQHKFEMIVDTGASGTVITQEMAYALAVFPVGTTKANTASARKVEFPIGYVHSMAVAGVIANKVTVAIAGPELETGLLGHDFFGNYDVTIRRDVVEFSRQLPSQVNSLETGLAVPIFPKQNHSEEFPWTN